MLLLAMAPAARAEWRVASPTLYRWYDDAGNPTGRYITADQFNANVNRLVAAGQEAFGGASVPTDISTTDAAAGVRTWDSLQTAGTALKSEAMDLIGAEGAWAGVGAAMPSFAIGALGAATFYVGWQIGGQIDHLLGIDTGTGTDFAGGAITVSPSRVQYEPAGTDLSTVSAFCDSAACTVEHTILPIASWVVTWSPTSSSDVHEIVGLPLDNHSCDYYVTGRPAGSYYVDTAVSDIPTGTGCANADPTTGIKPGCSSCFHDKVLVVPVDTANVPGPGQGIPLGGDSQLSTTSYTGPSEDGKKRNAAGALQNPALTPDIVWWCSQNQDVCGPPLPTATPSVTIPTPAVGEDFPDYKVDLVNAGVTGSITNTVLDATSADPSKPPNSVTQVNPGPGSRVAPSTAVKVYTNPDNTPSTPPGGGSPLAASAPGISIPTVTTPCSVFPFGIPCWLLRQLGVLSGTATAPNFTIGMPSAICGSGCAMDVNLDHPFGADLSSIMAVARPILLFLSFVGLGVWLAGLAMGGSTGGGGGDWEDD